MAEPNNEDALIQAQVEAELEESKALAKQFSEDELNGGDWFVRLLQLVVGSYDKNVRASYFQKKYPGLSRDEIADTLTTVTVRYAMIAGGVSGVAATAGELSTLLTGGVTMSIFLGAIGAEMLYLTRIQMRLVLDLALIYEQNLDPEDPEDVLTVFAYALGVMPTGVAGGVIQKATQTVTTRSIRTYLSKGTLKSVQDMGRKVGIKILQRSVIKYAVPIASIATGAAYNYVVTKSVGNIAKLHFKERGNVTEELRTLVARQTDYDFAFLGAAFYMAKVDGEFSQQEKGLYQGLLLRISFDDHAREKLETLIQADEATLLDILSQIEDTYIQENLIEVLILMAAYDGVLAPEETNLVMRVAAHFGLSLTSEQIEARFIEYTETLPKNFWERTVNRFKSASQESWTKADQTARYIGQVSIQSTQKLRQLFRRLPDSDTNNSTAEEI